MPAKKTTGGITALEVQSKLPATYFVMRGNLQAAFGFSRTEIDALISSGVFVAKYPFGPKTRARFVRTQVLAAVRKWEASPAEPIPK